MWMGDQSASRDAFTTPVRPADTRMIQKPRSVVSRSRIASAIASGKIRMTWLYAYLSTLVVFVLCDMVWLTTMANRLYRPTLGDIMLANAKMLPAVAFYLIYPAGLVIFAVLPAVKSGSLAQAATLGALLGFFSYMTYDLTNQATLTKLDLSAHARRRHLGHVVGRNIRCGCVFDHRPANGLKRISETGRKRASAPEPREIARHANAACVAPAAECPRRRPVSSTCRLAPIT